ncbi:hydrogenase expression/formation protein HypD [Cyanobium sp. PCC 7001]|uniref:hydrogenase formation protein HypD n=1 Tax=Cyanobium sp. PCC 7001 TaxID=180281 RepID=UPI0001804F18|nr:hydrogenase expression/formation protein HypD [Cyanobium sp. PCC 7001]
MSRVAELAERLRASVTRPWTLMEVCGGQTHAIVRWGLDQLLPEGLRLIHGPGCPVCVTPAATLDAALALARRPDVILCSYGDMLRVPGSAPGDDLLGARAAGGDVRLLTSPLQAIGLARENPGRQVVFLAVGFETTAPATALLARQALSLGLSNLSLLNAHVRVPPAMAAILEAPGNQVQGFLAAGHVCTVMGLQELEPLAAGHGVPVVATGFEPEDLLLGLWRCVQLLEAGTPAVVNAYGQVVREHGNPGARALLEEVFAVVDQPWRGLGVIPGGGLGLRPAYADLDARRRFGGFCGEAPGFGGVNSTSGDGFGDGPSACIAGQILQGRAVPTDCPAFGGRCRPEHPLGAPMVSSEGACAAYHRYRSAEATTVAAAAPAL